MKFVFEVDVTQKEAAIATGLGNLLIELGKQLRAIRKPNGELIVFADLPESGFSCEMQFEGDDLDTEVSARYYINREPFDRQRKIVNPGTIMDVNGEISHAEGAPW